MFLSTKGTPLEYRNWIRHGWHPALKRAGVQPRVRDAQKALRRTYVTSSLVLDRNPKLVAAELGHTTARMVTDNYDSWMDPSRWPDERELNRLRTIYGWAKPRAEAPEAHAPELTFDGSQWHACGTHGCDGQRRINPAKLSA